jgi:hypothetical protein
MALVVLVALVAHSWAILQKNRQKPDSKKS